MSEVTVETRSELAASNEGATLLTVISRAANDPNTDVDKLERLMALYERLEGRRASAEFASDLAMMQAELPSISERGGIKNREGVVQSTYALWEDVNEAIKPVLQKYGFALSFRTDFTDGIKISGVLSHKGGHKEETSIVLPADSSGSKNAVQAIGSSVSYGKRYTAGALLNLTSHGEDDDGYKGGGGYDATDWFTKIDDCANKADLDAVGAELKAAKGIPANVMRNIRAAWAKRAQAVA